MKNTTTIIWIILMALTIVSALVYGLKTKYVTLIVLVLSVLKFLGIAFQFMEIKNANSFWKTSIIVFLSGFIITFLMVT